VSGRPREWVGELGIHVERDVISKVHPHQVLSSETDVLHGPEAELQFGGDGTLSVTGPAERTLRCPLRVTD
jgi:hypothetical protein